MVALGGREVASGTVTFLKPGRMRWEYQLPDPQTFLVRDESVWLYQPSLGQLVIDSLRSVLLADLPVAFLMGIGDLDRQFKAVRGCANSEFLVLVLAPREATVGQEEVQLESFELLVSKSSFLPAGARVLDVGGNATLIRLLDV
jgi:outer membrane lipoprotein carrier protein